MHFELVTPMYLVTTNGTTVVMLVVSHVKNREGIPMTMCTLKRRNKRRCKSDMK